MISPATLLKLASVYQLVSRAAAPVDDYGKMQELMHKAWRSVYDGEKKVKMSGPRTQKAEKVYTVRLAQRTLHFIKAAKAMRDAIRIFNRSLKSGKVSYRPEFVQLLTEHQMVVADFLKKANAFTNNDNQIVISALMGNLSAGAFGPNDLKALATTVRKVNNAFLGNVVLLRPEEEAAAELETLKEKPEPKPAKPRKRKPKAAPPEGVIVIAPGIIRGRLPKKKITTEAPAEEPEEVAPAPMTPEEMAQAERDMMIGKEPTAEPEATTPWQEEWERIQREREMVAGA